MPQADITPNLLRSSRRQPNLSAYACLNGNFDFHQSPLAPPGTRVVVHITPAQRPNMGPHGIDGWCIGPSIEHYHCHKCYIPSTFGVRDALTIDWFPNNVPFPRVNADEYLRQTANNMLTLIRDKATHPIPSLTYGSNITNAYIQIAQILKRATAPPVPTPDPAPEPRVPLTTPPAPEQRVLVPAPILPIPIQQQPTLPATKKHVPATRPTARFPLPRLGQRNTSYQHCHTSTNYQPLAQCTINERYAHHVTALATAPPTTGKQGFLTKLLRGPDATIWERSLANEWGRLLAYSLGISRPASEQVKGTRTAFFIEKDQVPKDHRVTYANFICNIRPQKTETHRVRMTAGGDKLDYPGDASSPAVSMLDTKLHINSTISNTENGARYLGLHIKNLYLGTPCHTSSTYESDHPSFRKKSGTITATPFPSPATATSTSKSVAACTASKKPAFSLSTNSSRN